MYERLSHCPLCESEDFQNKRICKDYLVSKESFVVVRCTNCCFEFTNPRPKTDAIGDYYQSESYISHSNKIASITDIVYRLARFFTLRKKLKLINTFSEKRQLLDYGCGTGAFLNTCQNGGWQTSGIEPDEKANKIANEITKASIFSNIDDLDKEVSFNIITLWHVLEHVTDINQLIDKLKQKLNKNGKLIVAVPNHNSYDQQIYKQHWAAYDLPRHLYHFEQKTIKAMMLNHKLKLIKTIPMKLDAYYVSLLSEQNLNNDGKKTANKYYKAIVNGYKSNAYAKGNKNNYSSLIYVFEK